MRRGPLVVLVAGMMAVGVVSPAAAGVQYEAGSAGLGDPYFPNSGNGGYDVQRYYLKTDYDPATRVLTGTTTITATATQNLSRFNLDLYKMNVRSVRVDGRDASFERTGERELEITPSAGLPKTRVFTVVVRYDGVPQPLTGPFVFNDLYGFLPTKDGATVMGEPDGAATWFPSNDHPTDKALFTIETTVPSGLKAISNGSLVGQWSAGGKDTFLWREDRPMATYLVSNSIGHFNVSTTTTSKGISQLDAVDQDVASDPDALNTPRLTTRVTDELGDRFGPYPFGTTGSIVHHNNVPPLNLESALETQGRPTYQSPPVERGVAHEISHQWFGDSVSVRQWKDTWLNEGFAKWVEWYWAEQHGGPSAQDSSQQWYDNPPPTLPYQPAFWDVVVADPTRDEIFHRAIYFRGGMALQALRHKIGDDSFFQLVRTWVAEHKYGNASTEDFETLAQQVSGQDLTRFFNVWLHTPGKPTSW
ncbi:M1 family peptidase [Actinomadura harenae]|uniref:Aminopeptidase N n=1 Tax=Actinomadura harenae TaxID=2483351 RepID=A0A3M2MG04_9ACTN|nr:M1 family peptidase [Actinomadura harenae]